MRKYTLTDQQDQVLVQMLSFFNDLGVGGDMNQDDFDSLFDVVMSGGDLNVEITRDGHILTIGEAELVYEGKIDLNGFTK